jgi:DNA-binding NtrC family response regulator
MANIEKGGETMTTREKLPPVALVVDDDPSITALCARALERVGLHVISCDTSVKAANVMQLHSHRIVCILSDVVLATPGLKFIGASAAQEGNGARLLPLLKYVCPSAIAVQMSAYSLAELATMGYNVEVPNFLQKPFTPEMLRAMLKQLAPHLNIPRTLTLPADDVAWDL